MNWNEISRFRLTCFALLMKSTDQWSICQSFMLRCLVESTIINLRTHKTMGFIPWAAFHAHFTQTYNASKRKRNEARERERKSNIGERIVAKEKRPPTSEWWNFTTNCCELSWISWTVWSWRRSRLLSVKAKFCEVVVSNRRTRPLLVPIVAIPGSSNIQSVGQSVCVSRHQKYPLWVKSCTTLQSFLCRRNLRRRRCRLRRLRRLHRASCSVAFG